MRNEILKVEEIPTNVEFNSTLEIVSNNIGYFTHGFFKYPCKFIPHIPRWAIIKYTKINDYVIDPFAGSGTTLVEAVLHGRNAVGVDFDKLSQLLCMSKTNLLSNKQIQLINKLIEKFSEEKSNNIIKPDLHNLYHWFPKKNTIELSHIKSKINTIYTETKDKKIRNFLLTCFASIIRKCSYADDTSPKPYVSTRFKKIPLSPIEQFVKTIKNYLKILENQKKRSLGRAFIIADDARKIKSKKYDKKISLAVTSPPYINAFDYVRSLRLENAWLGFYGDSNIIEMKKKQVGTEIIPHKIYSKEIEEFGNAKLDSILGKIYKKDKKRAFVVLKFFEDMKSNFFAVQNLLKPGSHYVIVIGDSKIRGIEVPTHEILIDIAKTVGFNLDNIFSYLIKNRYLRIPRSGRGGLIKKDWVIDLVKTNG